MQVCATPGDARGHDPSLGLCLCWGQQSSGMCLERQRHILQLSCTDGIPQISVTEGMGSQVQYSEVQPHAEPGPVTSISKEGACRMCLCPGPRGCCFLTHITGTTSPTSEAQNQSKAPLLILFHPTKLLEEEVIVFIKEEGHCPRGHDSRLPLFCGVLGTIPTPTSSVSFQDTQTPLMGGAVFALPSYWASV